MAKLSDKQYCSGCSACYDACPKGAISMVADKEGFLYPQIDEKRCVNCGLCTRACPSLNRPDARIPIAVYAAKAKDTELRLASSSGGIFSLLARQILAKGGKVFGAAFDKRDWSVEHIGVSNEEGLAELRGSKYLQSRTFGIYREVKATLLSGLPVLFTGTPCQIAALRRYLESSTPRSTLYTLTSNLTLVDVVCHGVPSPMVWQKYLDWQGEATLAQGRGSATAEGRNIRRISFRQKNSGWKRYSLSLRFANDKEYHACFQEDPFMRLFLSELCSRPSCHKCQCRNLRSGSDLTLADYWGVGRIFPDFDDDLGTSLLIVNTKTGAEFLRAIDNILVKKTSTFKDAVNSNPAIVRSTTMNRRRTRLFGLLNKKQFAKLVCDVTTSSRFRIIIGKSLRILGVIK